MVPLYKINMVMLVVKLDDLKVLETHVGYIYDPVRIIHVKELGRGLELKER